MDKKEANNDFAFTLFKAMQKDNLGYIYRGRFSQEITDNILSLTETSLEKTEPSSRIKKRVYSIMVECLQNITRHQEGTSDSTPDNYGIFVIQRKDERYYITTGNTINKNNIEPIKNLIDKINSLEKEELKSYYKEVLNSGELSVKGGAGLGLIDMARKSGNKLIYYFKEINKGFSYFYLHTIPTLSMEEGPTMNSEESLHNIIDIHNTLNDENILLIYNGILNQESLMTLLSTIEGQMTGSPNFRKKLFYIVVEMLQNIVKHGDNKNEEQGGNPGIFFISEKDNEYLLTTGNYVKNSRVKELKERIEQINSLSIEELDDFYNQRLFNFEKEDSKKSGLGIIDLKIKSGKTLKSNFYKINDKFTFFTFQTKAAIN